MKSELPRPSGRGFLRDSINFPNSFESSDTRLERQSPGLYIAKDRAAYWDGRNDMGEPAASGVYYYRMQAGRFEALRKMVITK